MISISPSVIGESNNNIDHVCPSYFIRFFVFVLFRFVFLFNSVALQSALAYAKAK